LGGLAPVGDASRGMTRTAHPKLQITLILRALAHRIEPSRSKGGRLPDSLYESFVESALRNPRHPALLVRRQRRYSPISYAELSSAVDAAAAGLSRMGLGKGDALGILSANRPEWVITDLACLKLGAIVVPIYPTLSPAMIRYIIDDSGARILVVENATLLRTLTEASADTPGRQKRILIDPTGIEPTDITLPFTEILKATVPSVPDAPRVGEQDPATIVYTSGTTGEPKGVVLTHGNILSNVRAVSERYEVTARDRIVSYLPLCHMLERTCGYYAMLFNGATIAYAESIATVFADVLSVRPTIMLTVPRVVEKAFEQAVAQVGRNSPVKRWLINRTITDLNARTDLRYVGRKVPLPLRLRCAVLDRTIAAQFRKIGGGKLRILASGGAPLDRKIAKTYYVLGYNIIEGYGLTETSPVVSSNSVAENTLGTVGKPVRGAEVRIGEDDEILVRGPSVMQGYFRKPDETARAIDRDGWFHTGDQGRFDPRGNLVITGRIKDLIVTSYGKNIAAAAIEARICQSPCVSQVMLHGDRRKYITALVVPLRSAVVRFAREEGLQVDDYDALLEHERIRSLVASEIERTTADLASFEKVKAFALIAEEFTTGNGLLTPLMKLRRAQVVERHRERIESMYQVIEGGA
jgi:long-chain acyl-CoA synthetase